MSVYVLCVVIVAATSGVLYGYDLAVAGGVQVRRRQPLHCECAPCVPSLPPLLLITLACRQWSASGKPFFLS